MKTKKIYWKTAIKMLKEKQIVTQNLIDFKGEQIPVKDVLILNKNNIRVPQNLVLYNDDEIDCSDIPEITDKDIETGKIQWISTDEFPINTEVRR